MKTIHRFKALSLFLLLAYLLAACGGTLPQSTASSRGSKVEPNVVAFTGAVESMNGSEWTVGGQKLSLDSQASLDPNIALGDQVKVEAHVLPDGSVVASKVQSSIASKSVADDNSTPSPDLSSASDASSSQAAVAKEVFGAVEAMTADTITVDGVSFNLADFTEFKDALTVGDQVKLHVTVNADGTFTVREVEKSVPSVDNSNSSSASNDGPAHDANDDKSNHISPDDGANHDSNDDHGGGDSNSGSGGG